jgi:SPP1 gp7 family putative phage head morphogenesis protein
MCTQLGKNVVQMARKVPPTRFPDAVAVSYYRSMKRLIDELGKVTLSVFDEHIKPEIKQYHRRDGRFFIEDGPLDVIRQAIEMMKGLSLGIFTADNVLNAATNFVNGINVFNKKNMQDQGRVKGIDPTQVEPWLDEFMRTSIAENVSYISTIRDEYFPKIESIIYQGVKNGSSPKEIRDQLVQRVGMSVKRAQFIARDQTGSILGQMTAERHKAMGVSKFKWSTSKDERVRGSHESLEGKTFEYAKPPAVGLPGTDYNCRCTATPVFEEE